MKIRVGLIGLGDHWQSRHRPALLALSDRFEVKAVCCEVAERSRAVANEFGAVPLDGFCLLYTSPSPRDATLSRMPSSA